MSLTSVKNIDKNKYELEVKIDKEGFEKAINNEYKRSVKDISISGFRKGKAPRKMVEKMYGSKVFFEGAINECYPIAVNDAVDESKLDLVARPDVEIVSAEIEDGVVIKVTCYTKPEIEVTKYKGLEVDKNILSISNDDVDKEIQKKIEQHARITTVEDRAAEKGDDAIINFEGFLEGSPFEGGKGENHTLSLGSGQFIPGFEEKIVGHNVGEEFDIDITFPEDYHSEDLKGQSVIFKIKLLELKSKEYPLVDDEFAKDISEFDNLIDFRADIKKDLQEKATKSSEDAVESKLVDILIDHIDGDIPDVMFEQKIDEEIANFEQKLKSQGMALDLYLQYTGSDKESFRETFRENSEKQVKVRIALEKIVKLEDIQVSSEEIEEQYNKFSEMYKMEIEKIKQHIPQDGVRLDLAVSKAIDIVKNEAIITEIESSDLDKQVVKKSTKKKTVNKINSTESLENEKTPVKKTPVKKTPVKKTTAKKTPAKKAPSDKKES
ncbi:MAG: trigger factor [Oscillospiraceae bacterium]|nr:trigger factor [Oscillospiraceae bacterium]